jgi:hypothetical protein
MFESRKVKKLVAQKLIEQKANEAIALIAAKELAEKQQIATRNAASEEKKAENKRINDLRMERLMNRKKGDKIPFKELPLGAKIFVILFVIFIIGGIGKLFEDNPTSQESAQVAQVKAEEKEVAVSPAFVDSPKEPVAQQAMANLRPVNLRGKINDDIFVEYTKKLYPKSFEKYGSRMKDVEKARIAAAFLAASSQKCDKVYASELSDNGTRNNIQTFTDCSNNERFRFEESELKDGKGRFFTEKTVPSGAVKTQAEQTFSQEAAMSICRESVRASAKFPSSVDFSMLGATVGTSKGSGTTWVELEFEAKNGFGLLLPYKANCSFPIHGKPTINVTER